MNAYIKPPFFIGGFYTLYADHPLLLFDGGYLDKLCVRQLFLCEYLLQLFRDYGLIILVFKHKDIAAVPF